MKYSDAPTGRTDTRVTKVAVRRGNGSVLGAAALYVTKENPGATVLAVWPMHERDNHGNPGYYVEWEPGA
jgi:hypothetical protein